MAVEKNNISMCSTFVRADAVVSFGRGLCMPAGQPTMTWNSEVRSPY